MLNAERRTAIRVTEVRELHDAVAAAEDALLLATRSLDDRAEALRRRACELSAELLMTLARLERRLAGGDEGAEQREEEGLGEWVERQLAPSGVVHESKPNPRRAPSSAWTHATVDGATNGGRPRRRLGE